MDDKMIEFMVETTISIITQYHDLRSYGYGELHSSIDVDNYVYTAAGYLCSVVEEVEELDLRDETERDEFNGLADRALISAIPIIASLHYDDSIKYFKRYRELLRDMVEKNEI